MSKQIRKILLLSSIFVFVLATLLTLSISFAYATNVNYLEITYLEQQTQTNVGEEVNVATIKAVYSNEVKEIDYIVFAPSGNQLKVVDDRFKAEESGVYKVVISVKGFDGSSQVYSYEIVSVKASYPVLTKKPTIPVGFIANVSYKVPTAEFTDYNTSSPSITDYEVFIKNSNGAETKLDGNFIPTVSVFPNKLVYKSKSTVTNETNQIEYDMVVLEARNNQELSYDFTELFVKENVLSTDISKQGVVFTGSADFKVTYFNYVNSSFSLGLSTKEEQANFDSVLVTVKDAENPNLKVTLNVTKIDDKQSYVSINDGSKKKATGSLIDVTNGLLLSFKNTDRQLIDNNANVLGVINKTSDGKSFNGFTSGKVSISIEVLDVTASSSITVRSICGQMLAGSYDLVDNVEVLCPSYDEVGAMASVRKVSKNVYTLDEKIIISSAIGYDVLDYAPSVYVEVRDEDYQVVTCDEGVELDSVSADIDYTITPTKTGAYTVIYYAEDMDGNGRKNIMSLYVKETTAPTLNFTEVIESSVKVGSEITVPKFTVADNLTPTENLISFITFHSPCGPCYNVKAGDKIKLEKAGTYYIRYTVYDSFFNMTNKEFKIVCS